MTTVTGHFHTHEDAAEAVREMQRAGVPTVEIRIVTNDTHCGDDGAARMSASHTPESPANVGIDNSQSQGYDDGIRGAEVFLSVRVPHKDVAMIQGIMTKYNERGPLTFSRGSKQGGRDEKDGTTNDDSSR